MAADIDGVRVREPTQVQTGLGTEQKSKPLLVDCEQIQLVETDRNRFTTAREESDTG